MANKKLINYDDTRDVAIKIVEYLIDNKVITEFPDENEWDFHIQDVIHDELNDLLGIGDGLIETIKIKPVKYD